MKTQLGFGIIGCGMIARWHADAIAAIESARLIGVTDVSKLAIEAFARQYQVGAYGTVDEMLSNDEIDIVCICTPSGLHAPIAVRAAEAGKHIVVEKPMAINLTEADRIIAACAASQVKMAVISQLRFSAAVSMLKSAVVCGTLGRLVEGDIVMKYYRPQHYYDRGGWRGTWDMDGGGALMNQGIHGVDLLQYIMGPVRSISAYTKTLVRNIETEDTCAAALEFVNGALGVIQATTSVYPGYPRRLEVSGEKGTVVLEEDRIVKWDIEGQDAPEGVLASQTDIRSADNPAAFGIGGHMDQISDLIDAVQRDRNPLVDQYEGRKPIAIIMAVYESSRTRQPVLL
jgi:predicted dehydrogenase